MVDWVLKKNNHLSIADKSCPDITFMVDWELKTDPLSIPDTMLPWYNHHGWLGIKNQSSIYPW